MAGRASVAASAGQTDRHADDGVRDTVWWVWVAGNTTAIRKSVRVEGFREPLNTVCPDARQLTTTESTENPCTHGPLT